MLADSHFDALRIRLVHARVPMALEQTIGYINHGLVIVNYADSPFADNPTMGKSFSAPEALLEQSPRSAIE